MNFRTDLAAELKTDIDKKTGGVNAKKEQARIETEMLNFEQDLWEY